MARCECGNELSDSLKYGFFWPDEELLASQEGLCSVELVAPLAKSITIITDVFVYLTKHKIMIFAVRNLSDFDHYVC